MCRERYPPQHQHKTYSDYCLSQRHKILLIFVTNLYYTKAFSSLVFSRRLHHRHSQSKDRLGNFKGSSSSWKSSRVGLKDTGHERQKLQQTLLPIVKEYQRIQSILKLHSSHKATTSTSSTYSSSSFHLYQAILCGYVSSQSSVEDSDGLEKFERILEEGPIARERLITSNMGLVGHVVETVLSSYYHIPQHSKHFSSQRKQTGLVNNNDAGKKLLYSMTRQDLIQEGTLGLARAIEKYDITLAASSSASFSTYAYYWIRAAVLRAIAQKDELVRVPEHVTSAISKIVRTAHRLGISNSIYSIQSLEQDILDQYHSLITQTYLPLTNHNNDSNNKWIEAETAKRLAHEAGVSMTLLKDALNIQHRRQVQQRLGGVLTLEPWMTTAKTTECTHIDDSNNIAVIKESLSKYVSHKEMEALCLRYGLVETSTQQPLDFRDYEAEAELELFGREDSSVAAAVTDSVSRASTKNINEAKIQSGQTLTAIPIGGRWGEAMSFAEVGKQMKISAEYGRRLCSSAIKKLKEAAEDGRLDPALLYM